MGVGSRRRREILHAAVRMAPAGDTALVPEEVRRKAEEWLHRQGYPLEFAVARELRRVGYEIEQGRHWIDRDPLTDAVKPREIDVVASEPPADKPYLRVRLVVECKHASLPWIVLMADPSSEPPAVGEMLMASGELMHEWRGRLPWHLRLPQPHGFNVVEMRDPERGPRRETPSSAYEAILAATRGAWRLYTGGTETGLALPVVVTDGALLALSYDADGTEHLRRQAAVRMRWSGSPLEWWGPMGGPTPRQSPVIVDIVQAKALPRYAAIWRGSTRVIAGRLTV